MAAHGAFGMLPGVDRPALAATIPTRGRPAVLLDVGASVECRPQHLLQFAVMGSVYARVALGIESPRVGLLSIGEEATKGNELTREAHRLLKASPLHFIGNVEARDVYSGDADVIVCDGFTGNVALKISEGLVEMVEGLLSEELSSTFTMRVGSLLTRRALRRFRRRVDYSEYGGAPLLGVDGVAIVGHGRSSAKAVRNAVAMAYRFAADRFIERVEQDIAAARGAARSDRVHLSRTGIAESRHGPGAGRRVPDLPRDVRRSGRGARRAAEPHSASRGPRSELTLTENTQPAILTVSIAAFRLLASRGITPAFVAGHSLGEYSANVAAGTFAFADALRIVRRRGRYMQEAVPVGAGAMAAMLGLDARHGRAGLRGGGARARSSAPRT